MELPALPILEKRENMSKAIYPGSFDPITEGHLDIIRRAAGMFDELIIAIMKNPRKKASFSEEERKVMIEKCVADLDNVRVVIGNGLTVRLAEKMDCVALIRGIRAVADYEYELQQATANMKLNEKIETVFLVARPEYSFLSSSVAKEIAYYNGDISGLIPEVIIEEVKKELIPPQNQETLE